MLATRDLLDAVCALYSLPRTHMTLINKLSIDSDSPGDSFLIDGASQAPRTPTSSPLLVLSNGAPVWVK